MRNRSSRFALSERKQTSSAYQLHEETGKPINTIIISTGNPKKSETECWIGKVNKYTPIRIIFLKKYPGDQRLKNVKIKIENNKKLIKIK